MGHIRALTSRLGLVAVTLMLAIAGSAIGANYGPMMLQNLGADIASADLATFRANIGAQTVLGFTPLNKAGDTATGLVGLTVAATASAAGTTQGTATAIAAQTTVVTTVAASAGVVLPVAVGAPFRIVNRGANVLSVYPPSGAAIEGNATNTAVGIAVGGMAVIVCETSAQCRAGI